MERRKHSLFYLCNALQPGSRRCSALSVLKKNEGGKKTKRPLWSQINTCCVNKEQQPPILSTHPNTHTHTVWILKVARKCLEIKPRWSQQEIATIASSWGNGGGKKTKTRGIGTRRVKEKQTTMKRVLILFHRHWHILPHFHRDSHQQAFLCHDQHQAYAQQYPWVERRRRGEKTKHGRRRGGIMNPSDEAENSKEAREEQNKAKSLSF